MGHEPHSTEGARPPASVMAEVRKTLDKHLASRDRASAVRTALGAVNERTITVPDLYVGVLGPLLADTGAAWQQGTTRVWEEHYATAAVRTIVEALTPHVVEAAAGLQPYGATALLACPPEEHHDLGLRMLLDRFLLAGYDAHFLGADTPIAEIRDAAERLGADLVVLSASTHYNRVRLRENVERLRALLPDTTRIAVGGPAFSDEPAAFEGLVIDGASLHLPGMASGEDD